MIVVVAIVVAAGMVSGLLAIVADVGSLYAERRVVQNGADAAALAIAQESAALPSGALAHPEAQTLAQDFADTNAPDGATAVTRVCGTDGLGTCPAPTGKWLDCGPMPSTVRHVGQVRTSTRLPDGRTDLTPLFAGLFGASTPGQVHADACAQAAWGPARSAQIIFPILVPACPGQPDRTPVWLADFDPSDPAFTLSDPCVVDGISFTGQTKGFAFGSFPGVPRTCIDPVDLAIGDVIPVETSVTQWCGTDISATLDVLVASGEPLMVPVVGAHANQGQGTYEFTVEGFKALTILGYRIKNASGGQAPHPGWQGTPCARGAKRSCLYGFFGPATVSGDVGGGPDFGVRAVSLIP